MILRAPGKKPILVKPVRPSAAEAAWYRKRLEKLIEAMHASVSYWVTSQWGRSGLATDRSPQQEFDKLFRKMSKQWKKTFAASAKDVAKSFANKNRRHHDLAFRTALKNAGFAVSFQTTPAIDAALGGAIEESVGLIKSIPEQYFSDLQARVLESVQAGRHMKQLTKDLEHVYGVTKNRAALIARDQNNKITAVIHKLRQKQVGITKAQWVHTTASKTPREEHAAWGDEGAVYDVDKGMYSDEDGEYVWPGTPINCGCTCLSVVPGQDDADGEEVEP